MTTTATPRSITRADIAAKITDHELAELDLGVHEAGHAVVGTVLGGDLQSAVLTRAKSAADLHGLTRFRDLSDARHPQVAYSGPWSQAAWRAAGRPNHAQLSAVLAVAGCHDDKVLTASGGRHLAVPTGAAELVERCWPSVLALAGKLFARGEVQHSDVLAALGLTDRNADMGLAMIRSGSRPNTFTLDGVVRF